MEWIFIGIMIAIGFYLAPMVIGLILGVIVGILQFMFGKN